MLQTTVYDRSFLLPRKRAGVEPNQHVSPAFPAQFCDCVYLVDADTSNCEAISSLLTQQGMTVAVFSTAQECLDTLKMTSAACVILNSQFLDTCGLQFQRELAAGFSPPLIFIAEKYDLPSVVSAMKAGAIDFFTKPLDLTALASSVQMACEQGREQWMHRAALVLLHTRYRLLTRREREVLPLVTAGLLNKQAAAMLGITEVTLQIHRSQVMRKMEAGSLARLVRMADALGILPWSKSGHEGSSRFVTMGVPAIHRSDLLRILPSNPLGVHRQDRAGVITRPM